MSLNLRITALLSFVVLGLSANDDYSFDFEEIELKSYKFGGFIKGEHKYQNTNTSSAKYSSINDSSFNTYIGQVQADLDYYLDSFTFSTQLNAKYTKIDDDSDDEINAFQAYISYSPNQNHTFDAGKKSLKWGKGYFANPIAVLDRDKDPSDPEASREGYILARYSYNKSLQRDDLKNISFDTVYLKSDESINNDFSSKPSRVVAFKAYFLYMDTDIDLIYVSNNEANEKIGFDISKNLETNFEIHAEYKKENSIKNDEYLLGLRYLTASDLTIISEYLYRKSVQSTNLALYDRKYLISKLSQKEPFEVLYSTLYVKNTLNIEDSSHQDSLGVIYEFSNNINLDISYLKNTGGANTQFGKKLANDLLWSQIKWNF